MKYYGNQRITTERLTSEDLNHFSSTMALNDYSLLIKICIYLFDNIGWQLVQGWPRRLPKRLQHARDPREDKQFGWMDNLIIDYSINFDISTLHVLIVRVCVLSTSQSPKTSMLGVHNTVNDKYSTAREYRTVSTGDWEWSARMISKSLRKGSSFPDKRGHIVKEVGLQLCKRMDLKFRDNAFITIEILSRFEGVRVQTLKCRQRAKDGLDGKINKISNVVKKKKKKKEDRSRGGH